MISKSGWDGLTSGWELAGWWKRGWGRCALAFVELFKTLKLRREAAFACRVHDEHDFAFEVRERILFAFLVFRFEIVEGGCGRHRGDSGFLRKILDTQ